MLKELYAQLGNKIKDHFFYFNYSSNKSLEKNLEFLFFSQKTDFNKINTKDFFELRYDSSNKILDIYYHGLNLNKSLNIFNNIDLNHSKEPLSKLILYSTRLKLDSYKNKGKHPFLLSFKLKSPNKKNILGLSDLLIQLSDQYFK